MEKDLIAPCGMNCRLCIAHQFKEMDLNKKGFHRTYCPGCIPRGKNCTHMGDRCELLGKGTIRFCFECPDYPCKVLKNLDKRYRTKYHMSMIENLESIKEHGMEQFLIQEKEKWRCPMLLITNVVPLLLGTFAGTCSLNLPQKGRKAGHDCLWAVA